MGLVSEEPKVNLNGKYSIEDAGKLLGYTGRHLRRYTYSGELNYKINRNNNRMYITGREILRFWKSN